MVSLSERDAFAFAAQNDPEMNAIYAFIFGKTLDCSNSTYAHVVLLHHIAENEKTKFEDQLSGFRRRTTSETGGWYDNDSLVFFLLLGCERFNLDSSFLTGVFAARDRNSNPIPKRVTEVFRALHRKEYAIEGQMAYLKIPFLHLLNRLDLRTKDAQKAFQELTDGDAMVGLSPFLRLLALRAHDLILFSRRPQQFEDFDSLIKGVEELRKEARVSDAVRLVLALPYKWVLAIIGTAVCAIFPLLFTISFRGCSSSQGDAGTNGIPAKAHVERR